MKRLKSMGIEAIPKLNFSTCHDGWLKEYGRMVSTDIYRKVVKEIIDDTCEVFGNPRYMHLGMDEETMELLNKHGYKMLALTSNWVWKGEMPKPWPTGKDYPQDPKAAEWMYSFAKSNFADENFMGMMIAPWGEIKPDLHYYWQSAIDQLADAMEG